MNVMLLPVFCIAVPLAAGALLLPFTKHAPKWLGSVTATVISAAVTAAAGILALYCSTHAPIELWMGGWTPHNGMAVGIALHVDAMSAGLAAFTALLVTAASLYTYDGFDSAGTLFHSILLIFLAAMCGFSLTGDLFNLFVWFELMSAAAIALTALKIEEAESIEGAINLAVTNTLAGFLVLLGTALLYARTGALNMHQIGLVLSSRPVDALVLAAFALLVCGYFVKGAIAPFHYWLDDAHAVAPTPICVLFSGIMVQLALYGVARIFWAVFAPAFHTLMPQLQGLFVTLGVITALAGALMAFAQSHLKRLLAFSTISHSGMFVAAFALFNAAGIAAAALFVAAHGLVKGALFVCAGNYLNRFRSLDEKVLGGVGPRSKTNTTLYLIGGLALAGLPIFAISSAKIWYDDALHVHGWAWIAVVMAIATIIDGAAVLRSGLHIGFGIGKPRLNEYSPELEETECIEYSLPQTPKTDIAACVLLLGAAIWAGFSTPLIHGVAAAAHAFVNRQGEPAALDFTPQSLAINIGTVLFALALALVALYRDNIWTWLGTIANAPIALLRRTHTGIYTDYVLYMMAGLAFVTAWLTISVGTH